MTGRQPGSLDNGTADPNSFNSIELVLSKFTYWHVPLILFFLTIILLASGLFGPNTVYIGSRSADLPSFLPWRQFAFGPANQGHLPLWNPLLFSGTPFVGDIQSALFYPPNWLYWVLPLDKASNWNEALHIFLSGLWTSLWAYKRGMHPLAALVAGALLMFGGPYFYKVFAGHQVPMDSMAWTPLILMVVDQLFETISLRWGLVGCFAIAMQILGGYPQTAFMTGVAVAFYSIGRLTQSKNRVAVVGAILGIYAYGVLLAAIQLLPTYQMTTESTRNSGGIPYAIAASFSFPPENVLTLFAPDFFGTPSTTYWGRCYLWEMSLFIGVTGFLLTLYGLIYSRRKLPYLWGFMTLSLLLLAFGDNTPLFHLLYTFVPGFNKFRADCKFIVEVSIFLAMLAGIGMDTFIKTANGYRRMASVALVFGICLAGAAGGIRYSSGLNNGWWSHSMAAIGTTNESYVSLVQFQTHVFQQACGLAAAKSLLIAGVTSLAVAGLFFLRKTVWIVVPLVAALSILEVFFFASGTVATFNDDARFNPELTHYLAANPGDYRTLQLAGPANLDMPLGAQDIWGYNPAILGRYGQFIGVTQGLKPNDVVMDIPFTKIPPIYRMLRLRFVLKLVGNSVKGIEYPPHPLPHVLLVSRWALVQNRNAAFSALTNPKFDPSKTVLLETTPNPVPVATASPGTVRLVSETPNTLTIEAQTSTPTILLVTDSYSKAWRAVSLPGSSQSHYDILPANYVLRAIPLAAGTHRLRLEYAPVELLIGEWITGVTLIVYLGAIVVSWRRRTNTELPVNLSSETPSGTLGEEA